MPGFTRLHHHSSSLRAASRRLFDKANQETDEREGPIFKEIEANSTIILCMPNCKMFNLNMGKCGSIGKEPHFNRPCEAISTSRGEREMNAGSVV